MHACISGAPAGRATPPRDGARGVEARYLCSFRNFSGRPCGRARVAASPKSDLPCSDLATFPRAGACGLGVASWRLSELGRGRESCCVPFSSRPGAGYSNGRLTGVWTEIDQGGRAPLIEAKEPISSCRGWLLDQKRSSPPTCTCMSGEYAAMGAWTTPRRSMEKSAPRGLPTDRHKKKRPQKTLAFLCLPNGALATVAFHTGQIAARVSLVEREAGTRVPYSAAHRRRGWEI